MTLDVNIGMGAVLTATLSGMALGAIWYSPIAFGSAWMRAIDKNPEDLTSPTIPMIGSVIACLVTALALSVVISLTAISNVGDALLLGLVLGLGLVATAMLSDNLFCGWGKQLFLIQAGYRVSYIVMMSAIITAMSR